MKTKGSSEALTLAYQNTQHHIPEDYNLHSVMHNKQNRYYSLVSFHVPVLKLFVEVEVYNRIN
jgi:hypothetical protein